MSPTNHNHESVSSRSIEDCPIVQLTEQEYEIGYHIAAARSISYEGVPEETFGTQDRFQAQLTGVLGEMAVAKATRSELDDRIYVRGDPGHDLCISGHPSDVKSTATHIQKPDLIVGVDQQFAAEIYVLAHRVGKREMRLLGWAGVDEVTDRQPERKPGTTRNYIVPFRELHSFPVV